MNITYHADDTSLGDTSSADCANFRAWARDQIADKFPDHYAEVDGRDHYSEVTFSEVRADEEEEEEQNEIAEFCSNLWESCPWDGEYFEVSATNHA